MQGGRKPLLCNNVSWTSSKSKRSSNICKSSSDTNDASKSVGGGGVTGTYDEILDKEVERLWDEEIELDDESLECTLDDESEAGGGWYKVDGRRLGKGVDFRQLGNTFVVVMGADIAKKFDFDDIE